MDEDYIRKVLCYGWIQDVDIIRDTDSGEAVYCFITFKSVDCLEAALTMNGMHVAFSSSVFNFSTVKRRSSLARDGTRSVGTSDC